MASIQKVVNEVLEGVDITSFSVYGFIQHLALLRDRRIRIFYIEITDVETYGAYIRFRDCDCIFIDRRGAIILQEHTLLHELGHIVLGHPTLFVPRNIATIEQSALESPRVFGDLLNNKLILNRNDHNRNGQEESAEDFAIRFQKTVVNRAKKLELTARVTTLPEWLSSAVGLGID